MTGNHRGSETVSKLERHVAKFTDAMRPLTSCFIVVYADESGDAFARFHGKAGAVRQLLVDTLANGLPDAVKFFEHRKANEN